MEIYRFRDIGHDALIFQTQIAEIVLRNTNLEGILRQQIT